MRTRPRVRHGSVVLVGLIGAALASVPAVADTNHGSVAGVEYISDVADPAPEPGTATAEAECEGADEALGGGYRNGFATIRAAWASAVTPFDGSDDATRRDDGYRTKYINTTSLDFDATIWTICNTAAKTFVSETRSVQGRHTRTITADCPEGQQVTGGGGVMSGKIAKGLVQSSFPFDDDDFLAVPEDGWKVRVHNFGGDTRKGTATAICDFTGSTYNFDEVFVGDGTYVSSPIDCDPGEFLVSGGVRAPGDPRRSRVIDNYPGDSNSDGDAIPDDRWQAGVLNLTDRDLTFERFVICRD